MAIKPITRTLNGKNSMKSRELYIKRVLYNRLAFPENGGLGPGMVKSFLFGKKMFYGRVDRKNNLPIKLMSENMKRIYSEEGKSLHLVDFVAEAFNDMQRKIKKDITAGKLSPNDPFLAKLMPKKAYVSLDRAYREYTEALYEGFVEYISKYNLDKEVVDFETYFPHFIEYIKLITRLGFCYTQVAFLKSRFITPLVSGLIVDLTEDETGNDVLKMRHINSPSFNYYLQLAGSHGFSVDKHVPTRLVADLNSPFMQEYMFKKDVYNVDDVVLKYYKPAEDSAYLLLKRDMVGFYNRYIQSRPPISGYAICKSENIIPSNTVRTTAPLELILSEQGEAFFLNQYVEIRNTEDRDILGEAKKEYLKKRARDLLEIFGTGEALKYIEYEFTSNHNEAASLPKIKERLGIKG